MTANAAAEHPVHLMREIRRILAGRDLQQPVGYECLQHIVLRARFNELADAQRDFAEAHLACGQQRRLEQADNRSTRRRAMEQRQTAAIYG
jgi:hypothetical protein